MIIELEVRASRNNGLVGIADNAEVILKCTHFHFRELAEPFFVRRICHCTGG